MIGISDWLGRTHFGCPDCMSRIRMEDFEVHIVEHCRRVIFAGYCEKCRRRVNLSISVRLHSWDEKETITTYR